MIFCLTIWAGFSLVVPLLVSRCSPGRSTRVWLGLEFLTHMSSIWLGDRDDWAICLQHLTLTWASLRDDWLPKAAKDWGSSKKQTLCKCSVMSCLLMFLSTMQVTQPSPDSIYSVSWWEELQRICSHSYFSIFHRVEMNWNIFIGDVSVLNYNNIIRA